MIKGISFSVWTSDEIRKLSVVEITECSKTYYKSKPVKNGLRDIRLGPLTLFDECGTCKLKKPYCPGHFGHIELTKAVYHISWIPQILYWLRCICIECGGTLIKDLSKPDLCRNKQLIFYSKNAHKKCPKCHSKQPKYSWNKKSGKIIKGKERYHINDVLDHLHKLEDVVLSTLNMSHPKNMILTCLPVPPPHVRPPIMNGTVIRGEDDITYRLIQIMRQNKKLEKSINNNRPDHIIQNIHEHLQMSVTGYINHQKLPNSSAKSSKREYTSLTARLKSKEGRIRGNLMGKRCDFTGRSVITGDDHLGMHEVGIPKSMAETLTIPVKVTAYNVGQLQNLVETEAVRFVVRPNNSRIDMSCVNRKNISIDVGWTVERSLQDGDIVCFNRQPSLHKMSFMAHEVRVLPYSTLRMNLSCTSPYNADFDGDEMNIHALQTPEAQAEARYLMAVKYQIVSPQSNKPVMSPIQDTLIGAYLMTDDDVVIDKSTFFDCIYSMPGWDGKFEVKEEYTGRDLVSMALPLVNWRKGKVEIVKGKLLRGQLNKSSLGTSHGSLIHVIYNDCGPDQTILFINRLQLIVHKWLYITGFSIGISDMLTTVSTDIHAQVQQAFDDVKNMTDENEISARLNGCRDSMGKKVQEPLNNKNRLYCMVNSGSKGSSINISQIMAVVGQQSLCGKRIPNTWTERTLPHFKRGSSKPWEKGFIQHSYIEGLDPHELWFHAIAGREGIIDTACKTSITGYLQRKFMKALENLKIDTDGTVKNSDGSVLQFSYGDDGYDAMFIEKQKIETFDGVIVGNIEEQKLLHEDYEFLKANDRYRDPSLKDSNQYMLPIPVERIILNAQTLFSFPSRELNEDEIFDKVLPFISKEKNKMIQILLRCHLNSKKLKDKKITLDELDKVLTDIQGKLDTVDVSPGESVGAISAQSIGEPATQMTLNTFHFAGVAAKNVTLGIPRLNECINCIVKIKTPLTVIKTENPIEVYEQLKHYTLESIVSTYSITKTPNKEEISDFLIFPDNGYVYWEDKPTLVLYFDKFNDIMAIKDCLEDCVCAYTMNNGYPIFHIQSDVKTNIGLHYEKNLKKKTVKGIKGAHDTSIKEGAIHTSLTDINSLFKLANIEWNSIISNDVHKVARSLGIEAARATLINEIREILGFYGIYVNVRHILLPIDWITHRGILTPLTRHGIRNMDQSPLKRSTFEEVVEVYNQAACYNEEDNLNGISECIVMGKPPKVGTQIVSVFTDEGVVERFKKDPPSKVSQMFEDDDDDDQPWIKMPETMAKSNPFIEDPFVGGGNAFNMQMPQFGMNQSMQMPQFGMNQSMQMPQFGMNQNNNKPTWNVPITDWKPESPKVGMKRKSPSTSPVYSPTSPKYSPPNSPMSPAYSPTSPKYSPPNSPMSPAYSPTSPKYSPPNSPMSPAYSPTSPAYNPENPYTPTNGPKSPEYDPNKPPDYSPKSPDYDPHDPKYTPGDLKPSSGSFDIPELDLGDPLVPHSDQSHHSKVHKSQNRKTFF
ncbi:MAG: hypothetical protein CMF41_06630 [Legionellales bacterium]|nr:hypothetical protein [Legionellales bacterium]